MVSLSPRLAYLVSAFNLEPVPGSTEPGALEAALRRDGVAAVLHHEALPEALAQAARNAGAAVVVLDTAGDDPVADLQTNAARLIDALAGPARMGSR
ncbi:MAG: hypothetical protein EOO54_24870 [Haliea sp.]|nr:MAG: hypothetical protein EOO54_24870 [Haliea sp.]